MVVGCWLRVAGWEKDKGPQRTLRAFLALASNQQPGTNNPEAATSYGVFFFFTSTLLPITPPRMPPAAAPMMPPFTLSRLVAAPMIAPAAAPIAASRFVFFCTVVVVGAGAGALYVPLDDEDVRRAGALERVVVLVAVRSAAEILSSDRAEFA